MTWLHPASFWLLALAIPLIALHLRIRRRVRVVVPSLLAVDPEALGQAPPRFLGLLPRDLLGLLLELGALGCLSFAAAGPSEGFASAAPRPLVIVLDGTASTLAAGRFEEMKVLARKAIDSVGADTPVTVLFAAEAIRPIPVGSLDAARAVVCGAGTLGPAVEAALSSGGEVLVLTDGCDPETPSLAARPGLRLVTVGRPERNRALVGVAVERQRGRPTVATLRIREADGSIVERIAEGPDLSVGSPGDALPADDGPGRFEDTAGEPPRITVEGAGGADAYLAAALEAAFPGAVRVQEDAEVAVSWGEPKEGKGLPAIVFNAGEGPILPAPSVQPGDVVHPVMRGVDPAELIVTRGRVLDRRAGDAPLLQGPAGPIALAGVRDGHRRVLLGFDPRESTLPLSAGWPVFVRNAVRWILAERDSPLPLVLRAGSRVEVRAPAGARTALLVGPMAYPVRNPFGFGGRGGPAPRLSPLPIVEGRVGFRLPEPEGASWFSLAIEGSDDSVVFASALLDPVESDLTPLVPRNADAFVPPTRPARGTGPRDRTWAFALAGAVLLLLEAALWFAPRRRQAG